MIAHPPKARDQVREACLTMGAHRGWLQGIPTISADQRKELLLEDLAQLLCTAVTDNVRLAGGVGHLGAAFRLVAALLDDWEHAHDDRHRAWGDHPEYVLHREHGQNVIEYHVPHVGLFRGVWEIRRVWETRRGAGEGFSGRCEGRSQSSFLPGGSPS